MKETRVAYRYAKSLMDLSLENGELEKTREDMGLLLNTIRENRDLQAMLKSPIIKTDKKLAIMRAIFGSTIGKTTSAFIDIIIRKKREMALEQISEAFLEQYKTHKNVLTAVITSAVGLDDTLRRQVIDIVKQSVNSEVELIEKVNKDLIGGFILRVGDKQVDASIARKLKSLTRDFNENPFIKEY